MGLNYTLKIRTTDTNTTFIKHRTFKHHQSLWVSCKEPKVKKKSVSRYFNHSQNDCHAGRFKYIQQTCDHVNIANLFHTSEVAEDPQLVSFTFI